MKDISTVCPQNDVMACEESSSCPTHPPPPQASFFSDQCLRSPESQQAVQSPGTLSSDSGYSGLSPKACYDKRPPSMVPMIVPSPSTSFMSSHSPSYSFVSSPSSANYSTSPSASLTYSPLAGFIPSPSTSFAPETSPYSPPVTIKCEVDSDASMSPPEHHFHQQAEPHYHSEAGAQYHAQAQQHHHSQQHHPQSHSHVPSHSQSHAPSHSHLQSHAQSPHLPSRPPSHSQSPPPQLHPLSHGARSRPMSPGKTVTGNTLPPCRICLDKASGFHYGLNTCEACKGFFRRSLKRGVSYVCTRDSKCDVTGEKRNLCGSCRFQKCLALGMSKEAIKTGRYTHAKRTRDTLEIKQLMGKQAGSVEEDIDFDTIISDIIKAHDDFVISSTKVPHHIIQKKLQLKYEETHLQTKHFGAMKQVPKEEYQEIYNLTGIDIDNRRELMEFHVRNSERWIRGYIAFAKKLPGFRELSIKDQSNLVKYARIEFWFLGSYPGYDSERGLAVMPNGRCFTRQEMCNVWEKRYIDVAFDLSRRLQKLKIMPEEMIIVKAICLTAEDRCAFEDKEKVATVQWRMVRCLQYLLQKRCSTHAEFVKIFSDVFICLTDLRDLNEAEYQTIQKTQLYKLFTESPLIMEVLPY